MPLSFVSCPWLHHIVSLLRKLHRLEPYLDRRDPAFVTYREQALEHGLHWGAYFFGTGEPVKDQILNFALGLSDRLHAGMIDYERNPIASQGSNGGDKLRTDLATTKLLATDWDLLARCPLMWAEYGPAPHWVTDVWPEWTLWQSTDGVNGSGRKAVKGCGPCDLSNFNGDAAGLAAFVAR